LRKCPLKRDIERKIKGLLGRNRRGLAIAEIVSRIGMSRSSVEKYLAVSEARGEVENLVFGNTRINLPARRVAVQRRHVREKLRRAEERVKELESS
jgi:DNA-binding IclR family transcriptional regulator